MKNKKGCFFIIVILIIISIAKQLSEIEYKREFNFLFLSQEEKIKVIKAENLLNSAFDNLLKTNSAGGGFWFHDGKKTNLDSIRTEFDKNKYNEPQKSLEFATNYKIQTDKILQKITLEREKILRDSEISALVEKEREIKLWHKTKAGKLQLKHPNWSREDCQDLIDRKIWIGMSLEMVKYLRGTPDRANPSNYGGETEWQWCWDESSPSCFYGKSDGIITAYN